MFKLSINLILHKVNKRTIFLHFKFYNINDRREIIILIDFVYRFYCQQKELFMLLSQYVHILLSQQECEIYSKLKFIYLSKPMIPKDKAYKDISISSEGEKRLQELRKKAQYPNQHFLWTENHTVELPVRFGQSEVSQITPTTTPQEWKVALEKYGKLPALSVKKGGSWVQFQPMQAIQLSHFKFKQIQQCSHPNEFLLSEPLGNKQLTITFEQYYKECVKFAKALLGLGYKQFSTVNIMGFNSPEWGISFFGTILAKCIAVGIYLTNSKQICEYIAGHSQSRILIAENKHYADKYMDLLQKGHIDRIVIYGEKVEEGNDKVISWDKFLSYSHQVTDKALQERMSQIKPGNCCSIIYTSGTTGLPKGVMCSHDNFIWNSKASAIMQRVDRPIRCVSYLPLSHAAAQFADIFRPLISGAHVYFAQPTALQGTLFQTLREVRPERFFAVPRIWEKVYLIIKDFITTNKAFTLEQIEMARKIGQQQTIKQAKGLVVSEQFKLAKTTLFNKIKEMLGLDQVINFYFGTAPLNPSLRQYFTSINIFLRNGYGMTQSTAPAIVTLPQSFDAPTEEDYAEVGMSYIGTEVKLGKNNPKDKEGQICIKGRHVFMGYLKNAAQTAKTIDSQGFLHSGDLAVMNRNGAFIITGRIKELIITAGGENIPPILIENQIKNVLPCLSNVMVVGDQRPFLTCIVTLKVNPQTNKLEPQASQFLKAKGCKCDSVGEAQGCIDFSNIIHKGLKAANSKAISRAQNVQTFHLIAQDFSVESGILTPTLKLKRKEALKMYSNQIQSMYLKSKL